jgi:hypothetical protein
MDAATRLIAEPAPDAIASTAIEFLTKAGHEQEKKSAEGELKFDYSRAVSELTGRHETVLVLREALYRLSELHINGAFQRTGSVTPEDLYGEVLQSVAQMSLAQRDSEKAKLLAAINNSPEGREFAALLEELAEAEKEQREAARAAGSVKAAKTGEPWTLPMALSGMPETMQAAHLSGLVTDEQREALTIVATERAAAASSRVTELKAKIQEARQRLALLRTRTLNHE